MGTLMEKWKDFQMVRWTSLETVKVTRRATLRVRSMKMEIEKDCCLEKPRDSLRETQMVR